MNCRELDRFLEPFLDGEFEDGERARIEAHLQQCPSCSDAIEREARWRDAFRRKLRQSIPPAQNQAPTGLRARVLADVDAQHRRMRLPFVVGTLAAAAALLAVVGGSVYVQRQRDRAARLEEVAVRHARGLPYEVSGMPPEQVEAWFVGKLDHRVTVPRLPKAQLVGARLSNVKDKPAAHLTYVPEGNVDTRRVGLFVYDDAEGGPTTASIDKPEIDRRRGYNTATWRDGEIVYQLVTDLDEKDILQMLSGHPSLASTVKAAPAQRLVQPVSAPQPPSIPVSPRPLSVLPASVGHTNAPAARP